MTSNKPKPTPKPASKGKPESRTKPAGKMAWLLEHIQAHPFKRTRQELLEAVSKKFKPTSPSFWAGHFTGYAASHGLKLGENGEGKVGGTRTTGKKKPAAKPAASGGAA